MIRRCSAEDIPQLQKLFATVYRSNPRLQERDYVDWQFRDNPYNQTEDYALFCSWDDSSINGFVGYTPVQFQHEGRTFDGCWIEKWYAETGTVGIELLGRVMSLYDNRFMSGVSTDAVRVYKQYRIPILNEMPRGVGIIDHAKCAARFEIQNHDSLERMLVGSTVLNEMADDTGIQHLDRFDPDAEFRFDRWSSVKGYGSRTGTYLNWRYFHIPRHNYVALVGVGGQFAVYRIETIKGLEESVIRILEWNFSGVWAERAIAAILQAGRRSGAIMVDFFCTAREVLKDMERLGFIPGSLFKEPSIPYLFRPLFRADGISVAIDIPPHRKTRDGAFDSWYLTSGDSDIDRIKV
jgi:hypothetical protein